MPSQPDPLLDVATKAIEEMGRRLNEQPDQIPDHVLSKITTDTMKILERREKQDEDQDAKPFSLLDEIDTLPRDRAIELLEEELDRLELQLAKTKEAHLALCQRP